MNKIKSNKKNVFKYVYLLQHSYEIDEVEETKILGIFISKAKANAAIKYFIQQPGFKDYPNDFYIDKYLINEIQWKEGFISWDKAIIDE